MPMLRVRSSGYCAMSVLFGNQGCGLGEFISARTPPDAEPGTTDDGRARCSSEERADLPAVVSERSVRLGHLLQVVFALHRSADAVGGIEEFVGQAFRHRALAALTGVADEPADRQRVGAARLAPRRAPGRWRRRHGGCAPRAADARCRPHASAWRPGRSRSSTRSSRVRRT
jgi:hypothetical protein